MAASILDKYEEADAAFRRGDVESQSDQQLLSYLSGLSNQNDTNTGTQHRDIIRGLTINNILLKRHLDGLQRHIGILNTQNARTQVLVVALTIASLIGSGVQVWYAYRADAKGNQEVAKVSAQPQLPNPSAATSAVPTEAFRRRQRFRLRRRELRRAENGV